MNKPIDRNNEKTVHNVLDAYRTLWNNVEDGTITENFFELRGQIREISQAFGAKEKLDDCYLEFVETEKYCSQLTDKVWGGIQRRMESGKHMDRDRLHAYITESVNKLHYFDVHVPIHINNEINKKAELAFEVLTSYLLDYTDKVFEEIPDVDEARGHVNDIQVLMEKVKKLYGDITLVPISDEKGTEYVFTLEDGTERYEIVFETKEVFMFSEMHNAVSAMPLSMYDTSDK